jgi:acrylyl-CoA reductase (NADPH)
LQRGHAIGVGGFRLVDYMAPDEAVLASAGQAFKAALGQASTARLRLRRRHVLAACCQASLETAVRYTRSARPSASR